MDFSEEEDDDNYWELCKGTYYPIEKFDVKKLRKFKFQPSTIEEDRRVCIHCGIRKGYAMGTGDCGCEVDGYYGPQFVSDEEYKRIKSLTKTQKGV